MQRRPNVFRFKWLPLIILALLCLIFYEVQYRGQQLPVDNTPDEPVILESDNVRPFTSPAGILYGYDPSPAYDTRLDHVMAHTKPDASKPVHSVFIERDVDALVQLLDEAWQKRGPPVRQGGPNGRDKYDVSMGRVVGTQGERSIRLIMEADSAQIVTAYPVR